MENNTNNVSNFDIYAFIKPYLAKWYLFLISVLIFLLLGFIYIKLATPVYNIQSSVLIKDAKKSLGGGGTEGIGILEGLSGFGGMSTNSIENEVEIFKSKKLVRDVIEINHLQTSIVSSDGIRKKELFGDTAPVIIDIINEKKNKKFPKKPFYLIPGSDKVKLVSDEFKINKFYSYNRTISLPFANIIIIKNKNFDAEKAEEISEELEIGFIPLEKRATEVQNLVNVGLVDKDATVINLSMDYPQVDKAKKIISELIIAYNRDAITDKNAESQKTKDFIDDRISKIARELGEVESEKESFKSKNQITDLLTETKINLETTAEARQKEIELDAQLELTNNVIAYLNKQNAYQTLPSNIGLESTDANSAISTYNRLVMERNRLLENATPQNPLVIDISKQIASMRSSVSESLLKNKVGLELALNQYEIEQGKLSSRILKVPGQEKLFRNIERQQQIKENLYLLLLQKREETAISLAVVAPKARIVDPVFISDKAISPKKNVVLLASLMLGILLPFCYIYLREMMNNNITSKNDIKSISSIPIVAEIPAIKKNDEHLVKYNDFSPLAESFRILMTNMSFMVESQKGCKIIMVTSSIKGEGKTFVSMNLALTMGNTNNKVLIIGSDIRNPQLQRYNDKVSLGKGLTEFLHDTSTKAEDIINNLSLNPNCDIIYSGVIPPNPTELLKNGRLEQLLDQVKDDYQYVIIDTAPLLLVTDTFTITKYSDLILYVTRADFSSKSLIEFAEDSKAEGKIKNVAFVLNDIKKDNFGYGNKYGYGYNA